jgi:alkanesulfonate monooxygenase SsuD/methylene tetrahydromethanopterin reductase-like flavin-dependent oxidoreductase (luciferase family)
MAFDLLRRGRLIAVPSPEKAQRYLDLHGDDLEGGIKDSRRLVGTAAKVRADIEETAAAYGAEEAIVVTITHDHKHRRRSYELLAREFGLKEQGSSVERPEELARGDHR